MQLRYTDGKVIEFRDELATHKELAHLKNAVEQFTEMIKKRDTKLLNKLKNQTIQRIKDLEIYIGLQE